MTTSNQTEDDGPSPIAQLSDVLQNSDLWNYAWRPDVTTLDDAIVNLLAKFEADPVAIRTALARVSEQGIHSALTGFAQRAATFAVREKAERRVWQGLLAVALLAWLPEADPRDSGYLLLPLTDAARRVGANDEWFRKAARLAPSRAAKAIGSAIPHGGLRGVMAGALFRLVPWTTMRPTITPEGFQYGRPVRTRAEAEEFVSQVNSKLSESARKREPKR